MDIDVQNSKHKSQNTVVTSFEHRTQNIYTQNTISHIGFRTFQKNVFSKLEYGIVIQVVFGYVLSFQVAPVMVLLASFATDS